DFRLPVTLGFQCVNDKMRRKFSKNTCLHKASGRPQKVYLRTKNSLLRAFLFIGIFLFFNACFDKCDCLITNTNVVKVVMKDAISRTPATITFESVFIPGEGILYEDEDLSSFNLLVDPRATETMFVFKRESRSDTLVLSYNNQTVVLAPDCGSFLF